LSHPSAVHSFDVDRLRTRMTVRTLKLLAVGYTLKVVLLGLAWLMIPELPARAMGKARQIWSAVAGPSTR
jgi:hypothetical protein